jgi:hypothetical protein
MTDAEWLAAANRTVTAKVTVAESADLDVTAAMASRCVAGKVVQVVTATNGEDVPLPPPFVVPTPRVRCRFRWATRRFARRMPRAAPPRIP